MRGGRGFTLLEMLVVLVIIGLLAGLVGPQLLGRVDAAKVTTAKTQVRMLKGALQTLRLDTGRYPTREQGIKLLVEPPKDANLAVKWHGPYLDGEVPLDPWGNDYVYQPGPRSSSAIVLYSLGADGQPGGEEFDQDVGILPAGG